MAIGATSSTNEFLRAQAAIYSAGTFGAQRAGGIQTTPRTGIESAGTTVDKAKLGAVVSKYAAGGVETPQAVTAPREIEQGKKISGNFFMNNLNALQANNQAAIAYKGIAAVDGYTSNNNAQVADDYAKYDALKNFKSGNLLLVR